MSVVGGWGVGVVWVVDGCGDGWLVALHTAARDVDGLATTCFLPCDAVATELQIPLALCGDETQVGGVAW